MTPETPSLLRCPLDPLRLSELHRVEQTFVCDCQCVFPIRNGIPILLPDEAERPPGITNDNRLPCRKKAKAQRS